MTVFLVVLVAIGVLGTVAYLALQIWAAREDGRDQRRRDARGERGPR